MMKLHNEANAKGILVGSDAELEWMLPWWWDNYSDYNHLPVAFADFGMTPWALKWCKKRGKVLSFSSMSVPVANADELEPETVVQWEELYGKHVWEIRKSWFKKPLALMESPFQWTLWIDLDCQVLRDLEGLFKQYEGTSEAVLAREEVIKWPHQKLMLPGEAMYNSGVVLFPKHSRLIKRFAEASALKSHEFVGDQNLLSRLIFEEKWNVEELPALFNWRIYAPESNSHSIIDPQVSIVHWSCPWGKKHIKEYGGLSKEFKTFLKSF